MGVIAKALKKPRPHVVEAGAGQPQAEAKPVVPREAPAPPVNAGAAAGGLPASPAAGAALAGRPAAAPAASSAAAKPGLQLVTQPDKPAPAPAAGAKGEKAPEPAGAASAGAEDRPQPAARGIDASMVSILDPDGPEAEIFRLLRTRILFPQDGLPPRTILVTSALAEEGKSFVAANLAVNIAKNVDEHVLLVDADLRKPSIHARFGFNGVKGLSEYLSAGVDLSSLLLKTGVDKLTLLPSGTPPANPSELISSGRMSALVAELKARYEDRYIIIDSPPPLMAPETSALAKWVDGILVVARYGSTPLDLVEELISQLDREKVIGAVINRINLRDFRRYAYKKYYNKYSQQYRGRE